MHKAYCGYINNENELLNSASGGFATYFSKLVLEQGGIVFGVKYCDDFCGAEYVAIKDVSELGTIQGSKYVETRKNYLEVIERLAEGKTVLYFGLGCDIAALRQLVINREIDDTRLYTIELLCHGPSSKKVLSGFVHDLQRKYKSNVIEMNMRNKKNGWISPSIRVKFANGKIYEESFNSCDFGYAFSNFALNKCTKCQYKDDKHYGDLCIGDYWGIDVTMPGYNANGVSLIIIQTTKGEELISWIDSDFLLFPADIEHAINHNLMYKKCRIQGSEYECFDLDLAEVSLRKALSKVPSYRKRRFRNSIRNVLKIVSKNRTLR